MPTNDPTAPRVVGGGAKCNCGFFGGTLADHAEYCPASPHYRAPKPFAEAFPAAVLPEDGTTPPSEEGTRELLAERETRPPMTPQRAAMLDRVARAAGSLRETGAGRGEAAEGAPIKYGTPAEQIAAALAELDRRVWAEVVVTRENAPAFREALARLAASPEGGAQTEELTDWPGIVAMLTNGTIYKSMDDGRWKLRGHAESYPTLAELPIVASRLTRSPRAAGASSDTDLLDLLDEAGVQSIYFHDGSQFNPGSQSIRAALRSIVRKSPPPERAP